MRRLENADDTIYMYYDNPSAASASDANATFVRVIENVRGSWSLDENAGTTAADNSGYGNDGTISGATWTAGKFGSAENFDGAGDNINVGNDNSLLVTPVSVEAWIKPATGGIPTAGAGQSHRNSAPLPTGAGFSTWRTMLASRVTASGSGAHRPSGRPQYRRRGLISLARMMV